MRPLKFAKELGRRLSQYIEPWIWPGPFQTRIRWRFEQNGASEEWCDTPISTTRREFRARAEAGAAIRFRAPRKIRPIVFGFDNELDRSYPFEKGRNDIRIPLTHILDYEQFDRRYENASFKVRCGGEELTLVLFEADPEPAILDFAVEPESVVDGRSAMLHWETQNAETEGVKVQLEPDIINRADASGTLEVRPEKTTTYTLRLTADGMDDVTRSVTATVRNPSISRPSLICRGRSGKWEISLNAGDDCRIEKVQQGGKTIDEMNGRYPLSSFTGELSITINDGGQVKEESIPLFEGNPLIFKMQKGWVGNGRNLGRVTHGHFIVIAPAKWERTRTGHDPVEPAICTDERFEAHYIYREGEEDIGGFRECNIPVSESEFKLIGERVFDDYEGGELFVGEVPELELSENIAWMRVGEERHQDWKGENFKRGEATLCEILSTRQGQFYICVYDSDFKLLDSGDFRYLRDLKEIQVNGAQYTENTLLAPSSTTGHSKTEVRLIGINSTQIHINLLSDKSRVEVQEDTIFVEPNPDADRVICTLESATGSVAIALNLPRIWWRIEQNGASEKWCDTAISKSRREFRARAEAGAVICFRAPRKIRPIGFGFDDELDRSYPFEKGRNDIWIPLTHILDYEQFERRYENASFKVRCGGEELTLVLLEAVPEPAILDFTVEPKPVVVGHSATLRWETQNAETEAVNVLLEPDVNDPVDASGTLEVWPEKTTTYTLRLTADGMDDVTRSVTATVRKPLISRPRLNCRKRAGKWEISLNAGDDCRIEKVQQGGKTIDEMNGRYPLSSFTGELSITINDGGQVKEESIPLFEGNPLIFKMQKGWVGNGRNLGRVTHGHFIVIAPAKWERTRTGHDPVEPAICTDERFEAHYIYREGEEDIGGFRECNIPVSESEFKLIGERVFDDYEGGELFVGEVPKLKLSENIAWIGVGTERHQGKKGEIFKKDEATLCEILGTRQGQFYICVYDSDIKPLDNGDFRYLRDLKEIQVNGVQYTENTLLAPSLDGHPNTEVHFTGIRDTQTHVTLLSYKSRVGVQGDKIFVEPNPDADRVICSLESAAHSVDIALNLPRIWWRFEQNGASEKWCDTAISTTRREFRARAEAGAVICFRAPRKIKPIGFGFDDELDRSYPFEKGGNDIRIPLTYILDYEQFERRYENASFKVRCGGDGGEELTLVLFEADPKPAILAFTVEPESVVVEHSATLLWKTQNAETGGVVLEPDIGPVGESGDREVRPEKTTTYTLRLTADGMDDITEKVTATVRNPIIEPPNMPAKRKQVSPEPTPPVPPNSNPEPAILAFTVKPKSVVDGHSAMLRWETQNAETEGVKVQLEPDISDRADASGTLEVTPEKTTTYTLRLTADGMDDVTRSVTATVRKPPIKPPNIPPRREPVPPEPTPPLPPVDLKPAILDFAVEPKSVVVGRSVTLRWETQNAETGGVNVQLEPDIVDPADASGFLEVTPEKTTTYTLRLTADGMDDITKKVTATVRNPPISRPRLICRKRSGKWEIALNAGDDCQVEKVQQDGKTIDEMNGRYPLSSFTGALSVTIDNGGQVKKENIPLFEGKPLIFKVRKGWAGNGRSVGRVTHGHFIVIAPRKWERTRTGHDPVEPASCTDERFDAHYIYREGEEDIGGFRECNIPVNEPYFKLIGERVFDDYEGGELFVGEVPELELSENIAWMRVGEERLQGWKGENFKKDEATLCEILGTRQGRFYIRVYDSDIRLLDSGDFRYLRDLKEIQVNGAQYTENTLLVPSFDGHSKTDVRLMGINSTQTHINLVSDKSRVEVQENTIFVEPNPDADRVICSLESAAHSVDIALNLPRIWWRFEQNGASEKWCDTAISTTRREFRARAEAGAVICFRAPRKIKPIGFGFDDELDRSYPFEKGGNDIRIPLTYILDYEQFERRYENASFKVRCGGDGGEELTLVLFEADPKPAILAFTVEPESVVDGRSATLRWETQNAETEGVNVQLEPDIVDPTDASGTLEVWPEKATTYTLRLTADGMDDETRSVTVTIVPPLPLLPRLNAYAIGGNGRFRIGKGFSLTEIRAADLKVADVKRFSIRIDKRRRTAHSCNERQLKVIQVLFDE